MDIIGADTTGAVAQTDQPAALPKSTAAPGAKKDGGGGVFGLVLARLAGNGEADAKEDQGADRQSDDGADPAVLAALLGALVAPQAALPAPAESMTTSPNAATVDGAGAAGLPTGPAPQTASPNGVLQGAANPAIAAGQAALEAALADALPDVAVVSPSSENEPVQSSGLDGQSATGGPAEAASALLSEKPDVRLMTAPSRERSTRTPAAFGAVTAQDAGDAESGDESETAQGDTLSPVRGTGSAGAALVRTSRPDGLADEPTGPAGRPGRLEQPDPPLLARPAGASPSTDGPSAEAARPGESGTIPIQTALLDAARQPATDPVSLGSERLAAESLSAPAAAPPASASAPAMPKAIPPIHDPAPVAGGAFQRDTLQIQLAPTDLGRITMRVSVHARQVQAAVSVEHQGLGAYLVAGQGALDDAVRPYGLRVEEFRVDLLDLGAGRTGQGHDSPEFQGRQDALPGRPMSVAVPSAQAAPSSEEEPPGATAPQRVNVFA